MMGALGFGLAGCGGGGQVVKSGFVPIDNGQLYYEEAGTGEAVILIHGFALDTRMWDEQFAVLAQRFRVIRYDMRGFGKSSLPVNNYQHSADCKKLLSTLGIQRASLVGLSAGGRVAIDFAMTYPAMVAKLGVLDSFIGGYVPTQAYQDAFIPIISAAMTGDLAKTREVYVNSPLFPGKAFPSVTARLREMVQTYSCYHFTHLDPEVPVTPAPLGRLPELTMPMLMLIGESDFPDVQTQASMLIKSVPGLQHFVVPGADHMSNMEMPVYVNDALMRFLSA